MRFALCPMLLLAVCLLPAQEKSPSLEVLLQQYREATDAKTKRKLIDQLFKRGDEAYQRIAELAGKDKKMAELRDGLDMRLVVSAFQELEKKYPGQSLVFAGQFAHMKKFGKRAVRGALRLMQDYTLFEERYRNRAWEVLADLGDKSVIPELKKLTEDFLVEDSIQLGAAYAMAALGDTSAIEKKIQEYRERIRDEPERRLQYTLDMASIYYHGRQYDQALRIYAGLIESYEKALKERGEELPSKEKTQLEGLIAFMSYNAACNASLKGDVKEAYRYLAKALRNDREGTYLKSLLRDGDLKNLRADPGFKTWYEKARTGKLEEAPPSPPVPKKPPQKEKGGEPPAEGGGSAEAERPAAGLQAPSPEEEREAAAHVHAWLKAAHPRAALWTRLVALRHAALPFLERHLKAHPKDRAARTLYERLCATLVLDVFRRTEKESPGGPLTFAGQFAGLKRYGRRAAVGALHVLKDTEAKLQYRTWAGDALGDLGDRSVVPELKRIAEDFLYADTIQEAAIYALAALGSPSLLEARIRSLRKTLPEEENPTAVLAKIAHMYYRGRRYAEAIRVYRDLVESAEKMLKERADELPAAQKEALHRALAHWYYSLACNQALQGQVEEAFRALEACARYDRDKKLLQSVRRDGDLRALREAPNFAAWYERLLGGR